MLLRRDRTVLLLRKFLALLAEFAVLRLRVLNVVLVLWISRAVAAEMPNAINASAFSVFHGPAPRLELGPHYGRRKSEASAIQKSSKNLLTLLAYRPPVSADHFRIL
jgi:hypothetical protein